MYVYAVNRCVNDHTKLGKSKIVENDREQAKATGEDHVLMELKNYLPVTRTTVPEDPRDRGEVLDPRPDSTTKPPQLLQALRQRQGL